MKPTILAHSFEIYVPSHCRCGKPLPETLREEILGEVKATMAGWFGGGSTKKVDPRVERIQGIWDSGCGKPDEEFIDVVQSHTGEDTRDETFTDFTSYVAQLANRLTQEAMACRVDGKMFIYPATTDPKPHRCAGGAATTTTPKPKESGDLERRMALQAALQRMGSANDVRDIFCNLLHYEYEDATLPTAKWPDAVKHCLAPGAAPQVIADQNGFKIIYLQLADGSLRKSSERQLVQRLVKEDPGMRGLVVVSDINQKQWNLVNVKFDRDGKNRDHILLRRMRVGPGQPVRTAVERLSQVDVEILGEKAGAADLQDKHDSAFDVAAVTKQFFSDVANWYFWALKHATFPKDAPKEADGHDHVALIRLITRLIFCWFLREKGLIPDTLFDRRKLTEILDGFAPDKPKDKNSVFYHAILQNLFFATLSTEEKDRGWAREGQNMMAHSLYRFKECFQKPKTALDLFKSIPFLNGGLLECLDRDLGEDHKPRYIRIDGFSRRPDSQACVPDFLFFGKEREIDLSDDYGDKKFRNVRVRGLIDTLLHYNFTIEENTPIEEEVALDPELCGMVFENLLAAYNPETGTTARKQSGSFYTPREIVNYMVDEALIAALSTKLEAAIPAAKEIEPRMRILFGYQDDTNPFNAKETKALIAAIDTLKSLDPAVGSGAFPMGLLHKLVFILGKLDPRNEQWKERQIARVREAIAVAEKIEDDSIRSRTVEELEQQVLNVEESFDRNELDYGRKLYLIENCIYGVDIQPIAVQIAKMRFFISLIVDQKIDDSLPNRGIRPLPNLETKFVAANTLIGINRPGQQMLRNREIDVKEAELRRVREKHFMARTPKQKAKCRDEDSKLRSAIAELLEDDGWDTNTARKLARWDPYDQNASAQFFDAEWMFGNVTGFDVVVGNPPYVLLQNMQLDPSQVSYLMASYVSAKYKVDLYHLFIEVGVSLLSKNGVITYITPNTFLKNKHSNKLREILVNQTKICSVVLFYRRVFEDPSVDNLVFLCQRAPTKQEAQDNKIVVREVRNGNLSEQLARGREFKQIGIKHPEYAFELDITNDTLAIIEKIDSASVVFGNIGGSYFGIQTIDRKSCVSKNKLNKFCQPVIDGGNVFRYFITPHLEYIDFQSKNVKSGGDFQIYAKKRILVRQIGRYPEGDICPEGLLTLNTIYNLYVNDHGYDLHFVLGIINSRLVSFYWLQRFYDNKETFPKIKKQPLHSIPIPRCTSKQQKPIIDLVKKIRLLKAKHQLADTKDIEEQINVLVYELLVLTPEEIQIVEESTAR
jgi:adenine-specific DNA-methyltransferase